MLKEKYLGTSGERKNGTPSFHIHGGLHHKFNKQIPSWMWENGAPFFILLEYLRITHAERLVKFSKQKRIEDAKAAEAKCINPNKY